MAELKLGVYYRYPGEDLKVIERADRYDFSVEYIDVTMWQATGKAIGSLDFWGDSGYEGKLMAFTSRPLTEKNSTILEKERFFASEKNIYYAVKNSIPNGSDTSLKRTNFNKNYETDREYYVDNWWLDQGYILTYRPRSDYSTSLQTLEKEVRNRYTNEIIANHFSQPEITYWKPANGTPVWTLHIYRDDNEVFSRTEVNKQPIQLTIKSGCPSGTCSVDCGNLICCYQSNGTAQDFYYK